jgi:hypothetical protein
MIDVKGKRVYIFGPMTLAGPAGDWNFPAFRRAALLIEASGGIAVSPAKMDEAIWGFNGKGDIPPVMQLRNVIGIDLRVVETCDIGYGLTNWSKSSGSLAELALMRCLKMPVEFEVGAERGVVGAVLVTKES